MDDYINHRRESDARGRVKRIIYYILGIIEAVLVFRFILKMVGANPASTFVRLVYSVSNALIIPFSGIIRPFVAQGIETRSVTEPATITAVIVYMLAAWGIAKLVDILIPYEARQS